MLRITKMNLIYVEDITVLRNVSIHNPETDDKLLFFFSEYIIMMINCNED